jgi:hypothetical protein
MWPKKNSLKYIFLNCKKIPNPKQRICNQFKKTIIIIIIICICAKLQKRLPSFSLEISTDASRKAVKVRLLQIHTRTYVYTQHLLTHSYWPLLTSHARTHYGREPNNCFCCFSSLQNTRLAAALDCRNKVLKYEREREGHSFPTRYNNTQHIYYIYTHTHSVSLSPQSFGSKSQHG